MNSQQEMAYRPISTSVGESNPEISPPYHDDPQESTYDAILRKSTSSRRLKWTVAVLSVLLVATNIGWFCRQQRFISRVVVSTPIFKGPSQQVGEIEESIKTSYPPTRTILQPIYQDTEFNEEGKNKERADNLWKGLFPDGNGVVSLNKSEAKAHGLDETAPDPTNENNALYIIAGFHTMHCVTVLRTSLLHYHNGEEQTAPWVHLVHCLDMIRQTLMCNMDTTLMWLHDADTFADGQLHVCQDFWQLHRWATRHAG